MTQPANPGPDQARGTAAEPAARRAAAMAAASAAAVDGAMIAMLIELEGRCLPIALAAARYPQPYP